MGMRIVFSYSNQERIPSMANTMAARGNFSFQLQKIIPTAVHPYKQGGWDGSTLGVAWWRHGTLHRCHTVIIAGEDGTDLETRRITPGEQAENPL